MFVVFDLNGEHWHHAAAAAAAAAEGLAESEKIVSFSDLGVYATIEQ